MELTDAIVFAARAHAGQVDKGGDEYILHPLAVMLAVGDAGGSDVQMAAAVLHDVVEDTDRTLTEVYTHFGLEVERLVDGLTRRSEEKYFDYIRRVMRTPDAALVKIQDVLHNLSETRMAGLPIESQVSMCQRYNRTLDMLTERENDRCV